MMNRQKGLSLLELLAAMAIVGILTVFATFIFGGNGLNCDEPNGRPSYTMRAKIAAITADIGEIKLKAERFDLNNGRYPLSLAEIGMDGKTDPWGNPYVFTDLTEINGVGKARKDHNLHPVNTYFDIYSLGPDGVTATPFTSTLGKDDIVMANDGSYFGAACHYNGSGKNK
jgi:general secretion pathway protein G